MRRIALMLASTACLLGLAGSVSASASQGQPTYYADGAGHFTATAGPFKNHFVFHAETNVNGFGGQGDLKVFDSQNKVAYEASVTCVYVDPTTSDATIWGQITDADTAGAVVGGSVLLDVRPGTGHSTPPAGFGNFLFTGGPATSCGAVSAPPASAIDDGAIHTGVR